MLLMTAQAIVRPRYHLGSKERFNRQLAVFVDGTFPVLIVPPLTPENAFHGAPHATYPYKAGAPLPIDRGRRAIVLCLQKDIAAVLEADPKNGRILAPVDSGYGRAIVGFGFP